MSAGKAEALDAVYEAIVAVTGRISEGESPLQIPACLDGLAHLVTVLKPNGATVTFEPPRTPA